MLFFLRWFWYGGVQSEKIPCLVRHYKNEWVANLRPAAFLVSRASIQATIYLATPSALSGVSEAILLRWAVQHPFQNHQIQK